MVLGLRLERHPVLAEVAIAAGLALRRVAAIDVLLGALGQADEGELPVELGAVAPAQRGQGRRRGVGPRAARVGEVPDGDRLHKQHCGTWPPSAPAAPPRRRHAVARARALARRTRTRRCHAPPGGAPSMPSPATTTLPTASPVCGAPGARAVVALTAAGVARGGGGADGGRRRRIEGSPSRQPVLCAGRGARQCAAAARRGRRAGGGGGDDPDRARHQGRSGRGEGSEGGSGHDEHASTPYCESCRRNAWEAPERRVSHWIDGAPPTSSPSTSGAAAPLAIGDRVVRVGDRQAPGHRPGGRGLDRPGRRRAGRPRQPRRSVQGGLRLRAGGRGLLGGGDRAPARARRLRREPHAAGVDVTGARIGERWRIGSAELDISGPRVPCSKLGARMGDPLFPKRFVARRAPRRLPLGRRARHPAGRRRGRASSTAPTTASASAWSSSRPARPCAPGRARRRRRADMNPELLSWLYRAA